MLFGRALLHDVTVSDLTSEVARAGEDTGGEYLGSMDAGQGVRAKSGEAGTSPGPMERVKSGEVEPLRSDS